MWRFVNQSLYLSEGGEFISRFSSRFPLLSPFIPSLQFPSLSPAFRVSVSPHSFLLLANQSRLPETAITDYT